MSILFFGFIIFYIVVIFVIMSLATKYVKRHRSIVLPGILIILLLIPTWDYIIGKYVYEGYCKNDAGLHIYQDIEKVESIYVESSDAYDFLVYGYKFTEAKIDGQYIKYLMDENTSKYCTNIKPRWMSPDKCIARVEIDQLNSRYTFDDSYQGEQIPSIFEIKKFSSPILYDKKTGKKIAEIVNYKWNQGWVVSMTGFPLVDCLDVEYFKFRKILKLKIAKEEK